MIVNKIFFVLKKLHVPRMKSKGTKATLTWKPNRADW